MRREDLIKLDEEMVGAFVDHDTDRILSHCADDVLMVDYGFEPVQGKEAARPYLAMQFDPFSDSSARSLKRLVDGNELFAEIEWTSTNSGDVPMPDGSTVPATGKTITMRVAYYARVDDDGQIVEMRSYPDVAAWMEQLGLMG